VPNVIYDTPMGPIPLNAPTPVAPDGSLLAPPPGLEPALTAPPQGIGATSPVPAQPVSLDGTYSGGGEVLSTGGGMCLSNVHIDTFKVHGSSVRFGRFRGSITADGGLQMACDGAWIVGQFEGPIFRGQWNGRGNFDTLGCTIFLTLDRIGP
jgi:hypothetical protein